MRYLASFIANPLVRESMHLNIKEMEANVEAMSRRGNSQRENEWHSDSTKSKTIDKQRALER